MTCAIIYRIPPLPFHFSTAPAEHYCYLRDADGERNNRVLLETVFDSMVGRLEAVDPSIIVDQRPKFAADEELLRVFATVTLKKS